MDIQSRVAARRAELERQAKQAAVKQAELAQEAERAKRVQREQAVEAIAADLSSAELAVVRDGEELAIVPPTLVPLDVEGLKRSKIEALINREARKRWTTEENWLVIGSIVGGLCLIHLGGFGFIPLLFGLWRRSVINKERRAAVRAEYPSLA